MAKRKMIIKPSFKRKCYMCGTRGTDLTEVEDDDETVLLCPNCIKDSHDRIKDRIRQTRKIFGDDNEI